MSKKLQNYARYSGIVGQMVGSIVLMALLGKWLDAHFLTPKPYYTIVCSLLGVFVSLYMTLKTLNEKEEEK
jgi:F0F1-type ATP synthase assembly protein I